MIYGIGLDIIEQQRVSKAWHRFSERLARRVLHPGEWHEYRLSNRPAVFLAKRWAAKEAVAKAFGSGLQHGLYMRNIRIRHTAQGQPLVECGGNAGRWLQLHHARCHLSLSDQRNMVCAVAVLDAPALAPDPALAGGQR